MARIDADTRFIAPEKFIPGAEAKAPARCKRGLLRYRPHLILAAIECVCLRLHPAPYSGPDALWKIGRKTLLDRRECPRYVVDHRAHAVPSTWATASLRHVAIVSRKDLVKSVVHVLVANPHRKASFLRRKGIGTVADDGPRRDHVVQRRQSIRIAGVEEHREVLRVAIGRCEQPEGQLCEEELLAVGVG